jgi:hypothetical protein
MIPWSLMEPGISDEEFERRLAEYHRSMDRQLQIFAIGASIGVVGLLALLVAAALAV